MEHYNILLLEDNKEDADLIKRTIDRSGMDFQLAIVSNEDGFLSALKNNVYDIILTDNTLPQFNATKALAIIKTLKIKTPCIIITGTTNDELTVELMKKGACDYILKDRLHRLPNSILNAINNNRLEIEDQKKLDDIIRKKELMKEAEAIAHFGSWENDHVNNIYYWSDEVYRILGYGVGEVSTSFENVYAKIHPDDIDHVKETIADARAHLHHVKYSFRVIPAPGLPVKYITSDMFITRNDKGEIIRNYGLLQDITERKLAEKKIKTAERKYRNLFENNPVPMWVISYDTLQFRTVNMAAINHYGYTIEEFLSMTALDIRPDDEKEKYLTIQTSIKHYGNIGVWKHKKKNGIIIYVDIVLDTILFEGEKCIIVTANDITERKENEQKLRHTTQRLKQAQEIAHVGSWEHNLADGKLIWSDEVYRIYGLSIQDDIQSFQVFLTYIHPEDLEYVLGEINKSRQSLSAASYYHRIVRKGGEVRYVHAQFEYEFDNEGNPITRYGVVQDVTEIITAENNLKHTTERLKQAQRIAHIGSWELDIATGVAMWSDEACNIFGLPPEENKQSFEAFLSLIHPEDLDAVKKSVNESNQTLSPAAFHHRIIRKDGIVRHIYSQGEFEFNKEGAPVAIHGISHDITAIKEAEQALIQSEANLNLILDLIPLSIFVKDHDGKFIFVNKSFADLHGYTAQEMIGESIRKTIPVKEELDTLLKQDQEVIHTGKIKIIPEVKFSRHNGEIRLFHTTKIPYLPAGKKVYAVLGISQDITEIKETQQALEQSEANMRLIMDLLPQTIAARNFEGEFLFVNKSFASLYGADPKKLLGSTIREMIPAGNKAEDFLNRDQQVIRSNEIKVMPESTITDHNGNTKVFTLIKVPFTPAGQKERAILGIGNDITEQKQAEEERRKMTEDIVQRNIDLEQFSYIVSHSLRAPVANLLGIADLIKNVDLTADEKIYLLQGFTESVQKLDNVIIDLNKTTQIKNAVTKYKEQVNFSSLINGITSELTGVTLNKELLIKTDFSELESFYSVANYMYSIFQTLINKSIKYKKPGEVLIIEIKTQLSETFLPE